MENVVSLQAAPSHLENICHGRPVGWKQREKEARRTAWNHRSQRLHEKAGATSDTELEMPLQEREQGLPRFLVLLLPCGCRRQEDGSLAITDNIL